MPRTKLYEVLESLNRKGLVAILPETPQRYRANPVSRYFDVRLEELKAEETELKRVVGELMVQLRPATRQVQFEGEGDFMHLEYGRNHFPVLLRQFVAEAKTSLTIVADRLFLARLRVYEDLVRAIGLAARAVAVRILVPANSVQEVDGRRVRVDELEDLIRRVTVPMGDACAVIRDQQEYFVTRFMPNDLHAKQGNDRIEVGRDPEMAALWHRLATALWESLPHAGTKRAAGAELPRGT